MKPVSFLLQSRKYRAIAIAFTILAAVCLYRASFQPIADGVTIGGAELGGMVPTQARQVLKQELDRTLYSQSLVLHTSLLSTFIGSFSITHIYFSCDVVMPHHGCL